MATSPYNDPAYRTARAWLTANPATVCWHTDCDAPATTIDHVPALALHTHHRGARCCELKPSCASHNYSHGASMGNRLREPTSGWITAGQ